MEYAIVALALGFILGLIFPHKTMGVLKIDHTNPNKDVYLFELNDLKILDKKSRIFLKVDHNADLSQK